MISIPKEENTFEKSEDGLYPAVVQSVHDLGLQNITWQGQNKQQQKIVFVFEIDNRIKTGKFTGERFVFSKKYTLSGHAESNLMKDLTSWRGKAFTAEELASLDLEKMRGKNCQLLIESIEKNGKKYQNIGKILPAKKDAAKLEPELPENHQFEWIEKAKAEAVRPVHSDEISLPDNF